MSKFYNRLSALLLVAICIHAQATVLNTANADLVFKENKNQWDKRVLMQAETHSGSIFFCKNNFTYLLADTNDLNRLRHDLHRVYGYKPQLNHTIHLQSFRTTFENSNVDCKVVGENPYSDTYNYYIGKDPSKWATGVKSYSHIVYQNIYNNIDINVASSGFNLKYSFIVKAGAKPSDIMMSYDGVDKMEVVNDELQIVTSIGQIVDSKPFAYQIINGETHEVNCAYKLNGKQVSFTLANYDATQPLIIDPVLIFSTYSGSTADNFGYSATYDSHGNAYVAGTVFSFQNDSFPTTPGAFQTHWAGGVGYQANFEAGTGTDIGITKYDSAGTQRLYSTYLGGDGDELPHSLVVNSNDELYVFGTTSSDNFPVTPNAFQTTFHGGPDPGLFGGIAVHYLNGSDLFVTRFNQAGGALVASTYIGGTGNDGLTYPEYQNLHYNYADEVRGEVDIDKDDNVYIATCTRSSDFPVTAGAFQTNNAGGTDGVILKMNSNLTQMIWGTYLGGAGEDAIYSVAFDQNNNLYVAGGTDSLTPLTLPVTAGAVQPHYNGGRCDGFISHIDKTGKTLLHSTFYGGPYYDQTYFVETDKQDNVYVLGQVDSSGSLFIKNAVYNVPNGGQYVSKLTPALDSIIWSTTFGSGDGNPDISPTAFLVDVCNKVYISGWGSDFSVIEPGAPALSTQGLQVTANAYQPTTDNQDFYVMVLKDDASAIAYGTYFGSSNNEEHVDGGTSRFDRKGIVYQAVCAGCGGQSTFPTTPGVVSRTNNSPNCNNAVFKLDLELPIVIADFNAPRTGCAPFNVAFANASKTILAPVYTWNFGDSTTSSSINPTHTYNKKGTYNVTLIVTDPGSCNGADTISKQITVLVSNGIDTLNTLTICQGGQIQIGVTQANDTSVTYSWTPTSTLTENNVGNPYASPTQTTTYRLLVSDGFCVDTLFQTVKISKDALVTQGNNVLCPGDTVQLTVTDTAAGQQLTYAWQPPSSIISGSNTATPTVSISQNTVFTVRVTNQYNCILSDTISVGVLSSLPGIHATADPDTIYYGDTTQLHLTLNPAVVSYQWTPDSTLSAIDVTDPLAYPKQTHDYFVQVTDSYGCKKNDDVIVYVLHTPCAQSVVYIPNAFSPNGDGKNDVLYVRANYVTNVHFSVFDRWGQKVFETRDITKGWDGTFKGKKLDPGVFGYYVEGECDTGSKFSKKGNVTLLR